MIEISEQADLPILRLAYRAGHLTMRQMYRSLYPFELTKNMWNSFGWRVRRLAQHKFLDSVKVGIADRSIAIAAFERVAGWLASALATLSEPGRSERHFHNSGNPSSEDVR